MRYILTLHFCLLQEYSKMTVEKHADGDVDSENENLLIVPCNKHVGSLKLDQIKEIKMSIY